jgi:hypothetical protein
MRNAIWLWNKTIYDIFEMRRRITMTDFLAGFVLAHMVSVAVFVWMLGRAPVNDQDL